MNRPGYQRMRQWTRLQVAIWLLALLFMIAAGVLLATNGSGSWAVLVGCGLVVVLGLLRYRAETERANRSTEDHDE
jgi:protein-S-isoprenylcysteine O-methyltransferase Ste14